MKQAVYLVMIFAMALCIASCKKNNNSSPVNYSIVLATPTVSGNLVTLKWSKLASDSLLSYVIVKVQDTIILSSPVNITVSKDSTQFTDTLPLSPYVQYYVEAITARRYITSNKETYARTDLSFMTVYPSDAIIDNTSQLLYISGGTGIAMYDLQHKKIDTQLSVNANIGYCDLGTYNGTRELYVPREDGWLFIYNAATMVQIDQINVGTELFGVVCNNGLLYISGSADFIENVYVYNRATKSLVGKQSFNGNMRLKLIPGTNSDFFAVSDASSVYYLKYDNSGNLQSQKTSNTGVSVYADLMEVFPNGNDFITSYTGTIISDSLTYVAYLPHGTNSYTSFCFDGANQLLYAGTTTNTILGYNMSNYLLTKTIKTQGTPAKLFYYNNSVISVSYHAYQPPAGGGQKTYTFIEQF